MEKWYFQFRKLIWYDMERWCCEYMNAFNTFWENGVWKNGNWHGSYISYDGDVNDEFEKQLILRGVSWSSANDIHIWNVFQEPTTSAVTFDSQNASNISIVSWTVTGLPSVASKTAEVFQNNAQN